MKRCKKCGCRLDPGEWCDCEDQEPCIDTPRRQVTKKRTVYPREYNTEAYIRQRWQEFELR